MKTTIVACVLVWSIQRRKNSIILKLTQPLIRIIIDWEICESFNFQYDVQCVGIHVSVSVHFADDISENIAVISEGHTCVFSLPGMSIL